jgi:hypothetical protein
MQRRLQGLQRNPGQQQGQTAGAGRQDPQGNRAQNQQSGGEQRGQVPAARTGQTDARGLTQNSLAPPIGVGRYADEDMRQLSREAQERLLDAQELRRLLDRNSSQMKNLEDVIERLRSLDDARKYNDPEESVRLREAIDLLRQVEIDLSRDLARLIQKEKFLYADDDEAPSAYRKLVEEYYKALARGRPR